MTLIGKVLFVAWRSPQTGTIHPVGRLVGHEADGTWEFAYLEGAREAGREGFTPFPDFPNLNALFRSDRLPPLFHNRVMANTRGDFEEHFGRLGLPADARGPVTILARTGGRRSTDQLEVFGLPSFDKPSNCFIYRFFLRGVRHIAGAEERILGLHAEDQLLLRPEPTNPHDPFAVAVDAQSQQPVGYVPHCLVDDLRQLTTPGGEPRAFAERINPQPAPVHERLLVRLAAPFVPGFVPFSSRRYETIAKHAERLDISPATLAA